MMKNIFTLTISWVPRAQGEDSQDTVNPVWVTLLQEEKNSLNPTPVPEIIDPVFAKTSQYARFLLSENERFGLVFVKTGSINSGTGDAYND